MSRSHLTGNPRSAFKEYDQLVRNGISPKNQRARNISLLALNAAVRAVDPSQCLQSRLRVSRNRIHVDDFTLSLSRFKRIVIVAVGKASSSMMKTTLTSWTKGRLAEYSSYRKDRRFLNSTTEWKYSSQATRCRTRKVKGRRSE